jgi:hypothetical protein
MLVTARPVGVLVSTPSRRDRTWTPRMVSSWRAVATDGAPEPIDGDDDQVIALAEPAHALGPARTVTARATSALRSVAPCGWLGMTELIDFLISAHVQRSAPSPRTADENEEHNADNRT